MRIYYYHFISLEEKNMARMNISIPDNLKERMDKYPAINWSQTAGEAFLKKLNETELTIEVRDMTNAIARLKASKAEFEEQSETEGYQAGIEWAMKFAEYRQLQRLNEHLKAYATSSLSGIPESRGGFENIVGTGGYDVFEDDDPDTPSFVQGFTNGAWEVFQKA